MRNILQDYLHLFDDILNLISLSLEIQQAPTRISIPGLTLLIRIANDLRSLRLLVIHGYGVQALSLLASTIEAVYTIEDLGRDKEMIERWPTEKRKIQKVIDNALSKMGAASTDKRTVRKIYDHLCSAKHSRAGLLFHQLFEKTGIIGDKVKIEINIGPNITPEGLYSIMYVVETAILVSCDAISSFVYHHIPEQRDLFEEEIVQIREKLMLLLDEGLPDIRIRYV